MGPTPAQSLAGWSLEGGWTVVSMIPKGIGTGGNFSESYEVRHSSGRTAFLKALDFSMALRQPDPTSALRELTVDYEFERNVLNKCRDLRLRNVCTPIDDGVVELPAYFGEVNKVPYIIFDLARGSLRKLCSARFDAVLALRALHGTAVALNQLHTARIAHQDIKPSNVLYFSDALFQVADLGRAVDEHISSRNDTRPIPGDPAYAPRELNYHYLANRDFDRRRLVDMYLLGSLIFFFFSNSSATQALSSSLSTYSIPANTSAGSLYADMANFERAFSDCLQLLATDIRAKVPELETALVQMVAELCHPNPELRGERNARSVNRQSLVRYISRLDRLAKLAELKLR